MFLTCLTSERWSSEPRESRRWKLGREALLLCKGREAFQTEGAGRGGPLAGHQGRELIALQEWSRVGSWIANWQNE